MDELYERRAAYEMLRSVVGSEMCIGDSTMPTNTSCIHALPAIGRD